MLSFKLFLVLSVGLVLANGNVIKVSKPKAIISDDQGSPIAGEERVPINIFSLSLDDIIRDLAQKTEHSTIDSYLLTANEQSRNRQPSGAIDNSFVIDLRPPSVEQSEPNYYLEKLRKTKKYNKNEKLVNVKGAHNSPDKAAAIDTDYDKMDDPFADFIFDDASADFDKYGSHEIGESEKAIKSLKLTRPKTITTTTTTTGTKDSKRSAGKISASPLVVAGAVGESPMDDGDDEEASAATASGDSKSDLNTGEYVPNNQRKLDVVTQNGPGARMEFQMHGYNGPKSYKFGYDTGKGENRQFRLEERDNEGNVKGHYGYYDRQGKLQMVKYAASPDEGFTIQN